MKKFLGIFILILFVSQVFPQYDLKDKLKGYVNPEELVSLSESLTFNQAVEVLSKVSEKQTGKKIVSTVLITTPIGVEIDKMQYKKALFIIVQYNNLIIEETATNLIIKKKDASKEELAKDVYAAVNEREVKISAVIFEANQSEMRERGVDWKLILSKSGSSIESNLVNLQSNAATSSNAAAAATVNPPDYTLAPKINFILGKDVDGTINGLFRFWETEGLGKVLTRPTITAINGQLGKTKVGKDFSIKERDFAGNMIDKFYQSGVIIEVTPHIYNEDGIDYIFLTVRIENSTVTSTTLSVEKPITEVSTKVLLRDGEETIIGGLLSNNEVIQRSGVPILKDLPWWFLGLRYIFGWDKITEQTNEMITLLKVELLPTLKERIEMEKREMLKEGIQEHKDELEKLKKQIKSTENKKEDE
jgi:type II secretory pathway component GspD/PulD (secretin)